MTAQERVDQLLQGLSDITALMHRQEGALLLARELLAEEQEKSIVAPEGTDSYPRLDGFDIDSLLDDFNLMETLSAL